ncbi:MAG: TonB-dependent siderophore receptor [Colwellia sp.]|nr:TonB-dependent siderophore receptor [Colwellia sp.]
MDKAVLTRKLTNLHSRKKSITKISKVALSVVTALLLSTTAIPLTPAYAADTKIAFNQTFNIKLPAGSLANAITELSIQTEVQILVASELIKDEQVSAFNGQYSADTALTELVKNTGLLVKRSGNNALTLVTASNPLAATNSAAAEVETIEVHGRYTTTELNNATGLVMSLRETPQSVSIITEQMIQDKALVDMASVLKHTPGVAMVGDASEDYLIYVRGFVLDASVQVDGMITTTANSAYSGSLSQGIDPVIAQRIEVLKGAAGILSGLGEPSATVNMVRKRPTEEFNLSMLASVGSWDNYRGELDVSGTISESGDTRGRFVTAYQQNDYFLDRYGKEKSVLYGIIESDLTDSTKVSLAIDHINSKSQGVYNYNSNPAFYTDGTPIDLDTSFSTGQEWAYRNVEETSIMPEIEHYFDNGWLIKASYRYADGAIDVLNASLGDYVDKETGNFVGAWGPGDAGHSDRESETESFNIFTTGEFSLFGAYHELVVGFNYGSNEFLIDSTYEDMPIVNINDYLVPAPVFDANSDNDIYKDSQEQTGFYGTVRFSLGEATKLMLGGRVSSWDFESKDMLGVEETVTYSDENIVTPYVGIVHDINDFTSVYASHTGIFLPVTNFGADGQILEPTEGTNTEAGVKLAFFDDELNISAAIYQSQKDNVAEWVDLPKLPNGQWVYESIDGVKTDGYEIEISGAITPNWNIAGGYTHNTAEDKDGNARDTGIPSELFKLTTNYDFTKYLPGLTIGGSIRWQSKSYYNDSISLSDDDIPYTDSQPAYSLVDLMARYELTEQLVLGINFNNILDEEYKRSLWGYTDKGEPRSFTASIRWSM